MNKPDPRETEQPDYSTVPVASTEAPSASVVARSSEHTKGRLRQTGRVLWIAGKGGAGICTVAEPSVKLIGSELPPVSLDAFY